MKKAELVATNIVNGRMIQEYILRYNSFKNMWKRLNHLTNTTDQVDFELRYIDEDGYIIRCHKFYNGMKRRYWSI